jgi:thioesterase domain-containing protein
VSECASHTIIFAGAGGGTSNLAFFCSSPEQEASFRTVGYPGWPRYVENGFTAQKLVEELATQVSSLVPEGSIRIIGISLGGHLGYAAALRLQASGRKIGGFCAIDTFTATSASPMAGWKGRALKAGAALLRDGRLDEFGRFLRSRFWRASLRLAGDRLQVLARKIAPSGRLPKILQIDPLFEAELSMRLLLKGAAPWVASLDRDLVPLLAPAVLLRTRSTGDADSLWRRRCPGIKVVEIAGEHHTLFDPENPAAVRDPFLAAASDWC